MSWLATTPSVRLGLEGRRRDAIPEMEEVRRARTHSKGAVMFRKLMFLSTVMLTPVVTTPASAAPPVREVIPGQGDVVITGQCDSPILGHADGAEIITTYTDAAGIPVKQIQIFPGNALAMTNLETGTSVTVMGTGATIVRAESDGGVSVQITGHGPFFPHPLTGEPGIWYLSGRARATFDAQGNQMSAVVTGTLVNLCARLAV
jgi:hypothetical protein